jgi:hypothetical protein
MCDVAYSSQMPRTPQLLNFSNEFSFLLYK